MLSSLISSRLLPCRNHENYQSSLSFYPRDLACWSMSGHGGFFQNYRSVVLWFHDFVPTSMDLRGFTERMDV